MENRRIDPTSPRVSFLFLAAFLQPEVARCDHFALSLTVCRSEAEKKWAVENKASPWQEQGAGAPQGRLAGRVVLGMLGAEHGF